MKLPDFVYQYRRYFFPFFGAPCCEKMSSWLNVEAFHRFNHIVLAHHSTQTDLLIIVGRVSHKQAPILQHFYSNMLYPSSVLYLKGCSTHIVDYATLRQVQSLIPITATIDSCPITFDQVQDALFHVKNQTSEHP